MDTEILRGDLSQIGLESEAFGFRDKKYQVNYQGNELRLLF